VASLRLAASHLSLPRILLSLVLSTATGGCFSVIVNDNGTDPDLRPLALKERA